MTYRITKGDLAVTADTEAELRIALAVLEEPSVGSSAGRIASMHIPVEVNAPAWHVGGPRDVAREMPIGSAYLGDHVDGPYGVSADAMTPDVLMSGLPGGHVEVGPPKLSVVADLATQHVTVSRKNREILDAVILFPEGVSVSSLANLLGLKTVVAGSRIQALKLAGLVEGVPHHRLWRATTLARRAKLVTGS